MLFISILAVINDGVDTKDNYLSDPYLPSSMDLLIYLKPRQEDVVRLGLPHEQSNLKPGYHITLWRKGGMDEEFFDEHYSHDLVRRVTEATPGFSLKFQEEPEKFDGGHRVLRVMPNERLENLASALSLSLSFGCIVHNSPYLGAGEVYDPEIDRVVAEIGPGYNPHMSIPKDVVIDPEFLKDPLTFSGLYVNTKDENGWVGGEVFLFHPIAL